ncbi:MAG: hypothetical protein ACI835_005475, partial [Planctomycetota bacterium]
MRAHPQVPMKSLTLLSTLTALTLLDPAIASEVPVVAPTAPQVEWYQGAYMSALGTARHQDRMVCVYFWSGSSPNCSRMYQETLSSPPAAQILSDFVCYSADAANATGARLLARYQVSTVPTILLLNPEGEAQDAIIGFAGPNTFASEVDRIRRGEETVSTLRTLSSASPDDLSLRLRLSIKLGVVGARQERDELLNSIRRDDPHGNTLVGARLAFWDVRDPLQVELSTATDVTKVDFDPLYRHTKLIRKPAVAFEAWQWLGDAEFGRGDQKKGRTAMLEAWTHLPAGQEVEWATRAVLAFWGMRDELNGREKKLILEIADVLETKSRALLSPAAEDPSYPLEDGQSVESVVSMALSAKACALHINGKKRDARKLAKEAIQ